jgi:hypothetical protein
MAPAMIANVSGSVGSIPKSSARISRGGLIARSCSEDTRGADFR